MGPKGKTKEYDDHSWRKRIEEWQLDEETWKVKVILLESAGSDQDRYYRNKFEEFAAEDRRFVIKNICKTETVFMVNQLGAEKKVRDENLRVFEEGQAYLKDKKDIPADVLALIIKHLIIKMKEEYLFIRRQKMEVKEGLRRESATMLENIEFRGHAAGYKPNSSRTDFSPPTKPKGNSKGKTELNTIPELEEGKKYNTVLRERGEEWRDRVYVDDFPTDGPNLYVAVTGFMDPYLPVCLVKLGLPLTAIVQIRIDPSTITVPATLTRPTKRIQSQNEMDNLKFWEQIEELRISRETADYLKNTAFIIFSPPYWESQGLTGDSDKIYDEVCYLMYDIQDLSRQHGHYLDNMDIIHIPKDVVDKRYRTCYNQQLEYLPLECVTIFSLLDSILQTCSKDNLDEPISRSSLFTAVTLNQPASVLKEGDKVNKAKTLVKNVFNTVCKTDAEKKVYRVTYGEEYENYKDPIVIKYADFAKYKTFHIGNIHLDDIVGSTLYRMPLHNLWQGLNIPTDKAEAKLNFHVNMLCSCFDRTDVETSELNRLLHILAFRKLYSNRSSLKKNQMPSHTINAFKKIYLKRSMIAEPLLKCSSLFVGSECVPSPSFPSMTKCENIPVNFEVEEDTESESFKIKFLFDCPDISELVSAAEISNNQPTNHMIDDFEFFEDFSGTRAFQILLDAFNKFNCVDYKYCEVTDCILLMFFNSHDKDGIAREEWRCHLPTPLCLQDFFDFVLEEHYDWIQKEEKLYDEKNFIRKQSECQDVIDHAPISCIDDTHIQMDLLLEGSLKHQQYVQVEEPIPDDAAKSGTATATPTKRIPSAPISEADSKNSKKSKLSEVPKKRQSLNVQDELFPIEKPFLGYDLSDRRVEVFGRDASFFSKDGTYISTYYTLLIPINVEYILLNFTPGNYNSDFWIHKAIGENVAPEIHQACESFRISGKDHVLMNIKKQSYEVPIPIPAAPNIKKKDSSSPHADSPQFETKYFYSFCITWPNGLITESVYVANSNKISHIKLFHILSHLDEDMRCVSLNGEVIIFKTSGEIDVLSPDGSYINITKYGKRIVPYELPEDMSEFGSPDKHKKAKGKGKEKDKRRLSKPDNGKDKEEQNPLKYELHIEEYEITETSGLRQKWIENMSYDIEKLVTKTATEYCLGEVFSKRQDGTYILLNADGTQVVTFPNKTRIITQYIIENTEIYPEWTEEELEEFELYESFNNPIDGKDKSRGSFLSQSQRSHNSQTSNKTEEEEKERKDGYISIQLIYTIEHQNFPTVIVNKRNGKITINSPNNTSLTVDTDNNYEFILDDSTQATFNGVTLRVSYEACHKCGSATTCDIKIVEDNANEISSKQNWVKLIDSFSKNIVVNNEGLIDLLHEKTEIHDDAVREESTVIQKDSSKMDGKSETSVTSHGRCSEAHTFHNVRFMVLHRDLTCSELVHRAVLEFYQNDCLWQPWCNINNYDTFGDNRVLRSILTPINVTETEKWVMESKLANKPKRLTYKDLKKDEGKGFYHWMRPYERFEPKPIKPELVFTQRLPRAFILRTLEQQWRDDVRDELKGGKELLFAILRYRHMIETESETMLHVPIIDLRLEHARKMDELVQAAGHRIYHDLKKRLKEDANVRAKADITTKPAPPTPEQIYYEGEMYEEEEVVDPCKDVAEEREAAVQELEEASKMSPNLQRYWRRRAEQLKEEEFYLHLMREGSVPQYFRNILGGAIWWDMNQSAGDAVTKAERRKMKCVCEDEASTSATSPILGPM